MSFGGSVTTEESIEIPHFIQKYNECVSKSQRSNIDSVSSLTF